MPGSQWQRLVKTVAMVSTYPPRQCGVATFAADLSAAMAEELGEGGDVFVLAMSDNAQGYRYPERVRFEVRANVPRDYRLAADFLNINEVQAVVLQHEFGIFGGPAGSNVLRLLRALRMPIVTTLHTVLTEPEAEQRTVTNELARLSDRLVVMARRAVDMLEDVYGVDRAKVVYIPHGIPDMPFVDPNFYKDELGLAGKQVILTFGLISPGKGIEYMIRAMAEVVKRHPDAVYVVLGATHPNIRASKGEEYRQSLHRLVSELGLKQHVIFQNRFVTFDELCRYLGAADICVTPYLAEQQITSGVLTYALGAGKAVVSTPYWYAQEMLAEGRGRLVPFRDSDALASEVVWLLDNETERHAMRKRAYQFCRGMVWSEVARQYLQLLQEVLEERARRPRPVFSMVQQAEFRDEPPEPDLRHLRVLTDDTGILQHSIYGTPDWRHGYCTDDVARALIVAAWYWQLRQDHAILPLMHTYMAFLSYAFNREAGRFRNFMSYSRDWLEEVGSEDAHGRALMALGVTASVAPNEPVLAFCTRLFDEALPAVEDLRWPRAWALTVVACDYYLRRFPGDAAARKALVNSLERLVDAFDRNAAADWPWFEDVLTYENARPAHALIVGGRRLERGDVLQRGLSVLRWLLDIQTAQGGHLSIIGNMGWYPKGGQKARFDQQPVEVMALTEACVAAYEATRQEEWIAEARRCLEWFLGRNDLNLPLYDFSTGGCRDGLQPHGVNGNQGAESTLAWLITLLSIHRLQVDQTLGQQPTRRVAAVKTGDREPSASS